MSRRESSFPPSRPGDDQRPRLLLAEDDDATREFLLQTLRERYRIEAVADGQTALVSAQRELPDLVLSDVLMPGPLDGLGLLRALRTGADARLRTLPVILITGHDKEDRRVQAFELGADDYLSKPFGVQELLARVHTHLELARLRRREEEERLRAEAVRERAALLESITDAFVAVDRDWRLIYANQRAVALAATQHREVGLLGRSLWEVFPEAVGTVFEQRYREAVATGEPVHLEEYFAPFHCWLEVHAYPTAEGGLSVFFQDVTPRRRAEETLGQRTRWLTLLSAAATRFLAAGDPGEVVRDLFGRMSAEFGIDVCFEFAVGEEGGTSGGTLRLESYVGVDARTAAKFAARLEPGEPVGSGTATDGRDHDDPRTGALLRASGVRAYTCHPLLVNGRLLGALAFGSRQRDHFEAEEMDYLATVCRYVALARERTRLAAEAGGRAEGLAVSEARFRAVTDVVPDLLWSNDPRGVVTWYNRRWTEQTGQPVEEALGYGWLKVVHPEDRERARAGFQIAMDTGVPLRQEHRFRGVDGEYRWFLVQAEPRRDAAGEIVQWFGAATDIDEIRRGEQAQQRLAAELTRQVRMFNSVLSSVPDPVYLHDPTGRFIYANQAMLDVWGKTFAEIVGQNFFELDYPTELAERLRRQLREAMTTGRVVQDEAFFASTRLGPRFYEYNFVPLLSGEGGTLDGVAGVARDVTARRQTEAALRTSEARQAFLLQLNDALAPLADGAAIEATATRLLGEQLRAERAYYATLDEAKTLWTVRLDYAAAGRPSVAGTYRQADFEFVGGPLRQGVPAVVSDVADSDRYRAEDRARIHALGLNGLISVPVLKEGRLVSALTVGTEAARAWGAEEVNLVREVAERTWAAVERARAEVALRESEEKYRSLFNSIDEGFCVVEVLFDEQGKAVDYRFLEVNPMVERLVGLPCAVGRTARELLPGLEAFWIETYGRVAQTGEAARVEHYAEPLDRWFDVHASRVGGSGSQRVAIVFTNVTERKRAEAALRASEARTRTLAENLPGGAAFIFDRDLRYVLADGEALRAVGFRSADFVGKRLPEVLDPALAARFEPRLRAALAGEPFLHEHASHGAVFVSRGVPLRDSSSGEVSGVVVVSYDITERRRVEEALRASEEKLSTFVSATADIVYEMSADWREMRFLQGKAFVATTENPRGDWMEAYIPEDEKPRVWAAVHRAIAARSNFELEHRVVRLDGTTGWTFSRAIPLLDDRGEITRWFGAASDITARKRHEQHQEFLLKLADALRPLANPAAIQAAASRLVGEHLGVDRAYYVEVDEAAGTAHVRQDYLRGGSPSLAGQHRVADFGWIIPPMRRGKTLVIPDVANSPLVPTTDRPMMAAVRIAAHVNVPLVKDGVLAGAFCVTESAPRAWTAAEVELVRGTGERIWAAVERARAEEALREREERLRAIVESARDYAILTLDLAGCVTGWSPGAARIFGYDEAEMLGRPFRTLFTPEEQADAVPEEELRAARTGGRGENSRWMRRRDGERFFASGMTVPLRDGGDQQGFLKILRDQTAAYLAGETRRELEERFRLLVESVEDYAIFTLDPAGRVTSWNPGAERIKGCRAEEILGHSFEVFYTPEQRAAGLPAAHLARAAAEGRTEEENWRQRHDGSRFWTLETVGSLRADDSGRHLGFAVVCRDLSAQRATAEERERLLAAAQAARASAVAASQAKDQFLAVLSHELRTPLTPVTMAAYALGREPGLSEPARRAVDMIRRNLIVETQLIDDLLEVSRIVHGKLELQLDPVDVHAVVRHALETCEEEIARRGLRLTVALRARRRRVRGDARRLQQVFWNLLKNAVKFTPEGGVITVRTSNPTPDRVRVEVTDTGLGMDAATLARIFAPFEQAGPEVTRRYGGLGLGLSIAHAVVAAHGGQLSAASAGPGRGATFEVELSTIPKGGGKRRAAAG